MKDYRAILEFIITKVGGRYKYTLVQQEDGVFYEQFDICPPDSEEWRTFFSADTALDAVIDAVLLSDFDYGRLLWDLFRPIGDSPNEGGDE